MGDEDQPMYLGKGKERIDKISSVGYQEWYIKKPTPPTPWFFFIGTRTPSNVFFGNLYTG